MRTQMAEKLFRTGETRKWPEEDVLLVVKNRLLTSIAKKSRFTGKILLLILRKDTASCVTIKKGKKVS